MGSDIVLSAGVRGNLLALQNTTQLLEQTQTRLATGLKVNSALDDPTAFFTAASLNSRASDLNRLLDSVGLAVQTLKAADNGISAITKLVESAQATVRQALNTASTTAMAEGTVALTAANDLVTDLGFAAGDTVTVNGTTHTVAAGDTVQDLLDTLNGNVNLRATIDGGRLRVEDISGADLIIGGSNPALAGLTAGTIDGEVNTKRQAFAADFDRIRTQINELAADAGLNGINLLKGDTLEVLFNEDGSSNLDIVGVDFDSAGLGIAASVNSFQDKASAEAALDDLIAATGTLRAQASTFGSNLGVVETRQNFTQAMINTLEVGAGNLVIADTNEEGANMLALQTRQQLSSTALSLASQADQNVLRLFG